MSKEGDKSSDYAIMQHISSENIRQLILTVRGKQVLLDSDVARLYGYEVKRINETAQRNSKRFPPEFRFQLSTEEYEIIKRKKNVNIHSVTDTKDLKPQTETLKVNNLRSQIATANQMNRYLPYVFTEQGIGMLSGLLKNETAIQVSIGIMNTFVEMRQFLSTNRDVFARIASIDNQLTEHGALLTEHDHKFDEVFNFMQAPETPKQNIFYKGQFYDALNLIIEIFKKAQTRLVIIDNYADKNVLDMLTHKNAKTDVVVITSNPNRISKLHLDKYEKQFGPVKVIESNDFHDRFIVVDEKEVYAFGASFKDVGNKCFEVSKLEDTNRFINYVHKIIGVL